jgi:hypothetical protein
MKDPVGNITFPTARSMDRGSHLQMSLIPQVAGRRSQGIADSSNPIVTSLEAAAEEGPFWIE